MRIINIEGRERIVLEGDPGDARPHATMTLLALADDTHEDHEIQCWDRAHDGRWWPDPERLVYLPEAAMRVLLEAVALPRIAAAAESAGSTSLVSVGGFWVYTDRLIADARAWLGLGGA